MWYPWITIYLDKARVMNPGLLLGGPCTHSAGDRAGLVRIGPFSSPTSLSSVVGYSLCMRKVETSKPTANKRSLPIRLELLETHKIWRCLTFVRLVLEHIALCIVQLLLLIIKICRIKTNLSFLPILFWADFNFYHIQHPLISWKQNARSERYRQIVIIKLLWLDGYLCWNCKLHQM